MSFTAKELSAILKACRENDVRILSYQGLEVEFHAPTNTPGDDAGGELGVQVPRLSSAKQVKLDAAMVEIERHSAVEAELRLKEEELAQLAIENPVLYEQYMQSEDAQAGPLLPASDDI